MNYFEYFSEIEERFTTRRGSVLLLSTLDWALIETWREAEIPLSAVLRGIDAAFDRYEERKARSKGRLARVNGLAWCAQAVMEAATAMAEAAIGGRPAATETPRPSGFESHSVSLFLEANAAALRRAAAAAAPGQWAEALDRTAARLAELAEGVRAGAHPALDQLDRVLSVLEERLHAALLSVLPEAELVSLRESAEQQLAPFRANMGAVQLRQVRDQFVHKRLFEERRLPRLSLFYMPHDDSGGGPVPARGSS